MDAANVSWLRPDKQIAAIMFIENWDYKSKIFVNVGSNMEELEPLPAVVAPTFRRQIIFYTPHAEIHWSVLHGNLAP